MSTQFSVRDASVDTDVTRITDIICQCSAEQTSDAEVRKWMETASPGRIARHVVAVDEAGQVVGYGNAIHAVTSPANHFYAWIGVKAPLRRQGIGSAIWACLLDGLQSNGAQETVCDIPEQAVEGLAFAQKRGFVIDRHKFRSTLDLETFDETPFLPIIAGLEEQGIRFCTLADLPDDEATRRKYYELNLATVRDIPGEYWDFNGYPQFFAERIIGAKWFKPEGQILALAGDTFAGFASVSLHLDRQAAYNATTGVIREYRGRQLGLALKVLAARYARQSGARQVVTDNDSLNAPVLAINRRMGYQPQPGTYWLIRR